MTPLQAELHQAHKARLARMSSAAERYACTKARAETETANADPVIDEARPEPVKTATEDRDWLIVTLRAPSTIKDVQRIVAKRYGFTRTDLLSERRTVPLAKARQIAMFVAKSVTTKSLPEIGRHFGGRDHTTILHGIRKIAGMVEADERFRAEIDGLKAHFEAPQ